MIGSPHRRLFIGLFWTLLALTLVPLWGFRFFPTQDGPSHLYNAWLLLHLHDPSLPAISHYYLLNTLPSPNWIAHLILAALMLIVQPLIAEKILLSIYLIALPLAARFALGSIRRSAEPLSLLVFPLSYNFFLHMGFYNFIFCVPLFLVVVGYYLRHFRWGPVSIGKTFTLAALGLILYFAHLSGLVMAIFVIGGDLLLRIIANRPREKSLARTFWSVFGAFVPAVILTAIFLLRTPKADVNGNISDKMAFFDRMLLYPFSLVSYAKADRFYSALFLLTILAAVAYMLLRRGKNWSLPAITAAAVALSFVVPNNISQGGFVFQRMVLFVFLMAILSLATIRWSRRAMRAVQLAAAALTLAGLGINTLHYRQINSYLAELVSLAPQLPANHTLLFTETNQIPQDANRKIISYPVDPFYHAGCYLSLQSGLISLDNYEAIVGYFPILFQPMVDPAAARPLPLHNSDNAPIRITFPPEVAGHVDYVILFTGGCPIDPTERNVSLQKQLDQSFVLRGKSSPKGAATLYQAQGEP